MLQVRFNDRVILVSQGQDAVKGGKLNGIHVAAAPLARGGGGDGGGSPGEQGAEGVSETGEERAGSGISTMAGSGREIQKGKLSLFVTAYTHSKKRTQQRFLTSI